MSRPTASGKAALLAMDEARDFPANTCPASRHAADLAEALIRGRAYPMLSEDPAYCGESMAHAVASLWEARAEVATLRAAVARACAGYPADSDLAPTCVTVNGDKTMATTYDLTTLRDVFEKVPADKLELCMQEIADGMVYARHLSDLMDAGAKALSPDAEARGLWPDVCQWIDDGKEDKTINVIDAATGEHVFSFDARKNA